MLGKLEEGLPIHHCLYMAERENAREKGGSLRRSCRVVSILESGWNGVGGCWGGRGRGRIEAAISCRCAGLDQESGRADS